MSANVEQVEHVALMTDTFCLSSTGQILWLYCSYYQYLSVVEYRLMRIPTFASSYLFAQPQVTTARFK
jgi:hypothetical protein